MTYSRDHDAIYLDLELHAVITSAVLDVGRQPVELAVGRRGYKDPHAEDS